MSCLFSSSSEGGVWVVNEAQLHFVYQEKMRSSDVVVPIRRLYKAWTARRHMLCKVHDKKVVPLAESQTSIIKGWRNDKDEIVI